MLGFLFCAGPISLNRLRLSKKIIQCIIVNNCLLYLVKIKQHEKGDYFTGCMDNHAGCGNAFIVREQQKTDLERRQLSHEPGFFRLLIHCIMSEQFVTLKTLCMAVIIAVNIGVLIGALCAAAASGDKNEKSGQRDRFRH